MSAVLSPDRVYRYVLCRPAPQAGTPTLWVMLNPSTADEYDDDPTIRKCRGFQAQWYDTAGDTWVVNLFALRATDPRALRTHSEPVGLENDEYLRTAADEVTYAGGRIVAAWGAHPFARERARLAAAELREYATLYCLGTTKDGSPRHPLYVPYSQPLVPWAGYR